MGASSTIELYPKPGFDWTLVNWGGPDQVRTDKCSYCDADLAEDDVPLILWNSRGWCAEFCRACQKTWWGVESFDEPDAER